MTAVIERYADQFTAGILDLDDPHFGIGMEAAVLHPTVVSPHF